MPKKTPSLRSKPPSARKPPTTTHSRPTSSHGPPPPPASNPPTLRPPAAERARSHETESRRPKYPPTSRHSYYGRPTPNERPAPTRRDSGYRSVSPRGRQPPPPPPAPAGRTLRRRVTRDSDWMSEDESRPTSRRLTPSPRRQRPEPRPHGHDTPPWPSSPKPANARPAMRSYPTDSSRPDPRRFHSYEAPPSPRRPPGAGKRSPPSGYRPAPHLASDMLRGRPRSRGDSPLQNETHRPAPERRPSHTNSPRNSPMTQPASPRQSPRMQPASPRHSPRTKPARPAKQEPSPDKPEPQKKGFDFMKHLPQAFATYASVNALSEHADTAKEWADWFMNLRKTPAEIHEISAKVTTAKDTITQIQNSLEARPDIIDGDDAGPMRKQIDEAIKNATTALDEMTKLLQEISSDGLEGTAFRGLEEFYNSYKYKDEWEEKIKIADADLEKELAALSRIMVNIYSRALSKPAPPGLNNPVPPPAPGQDADSGYARRPSATARGSTSRVASPILEPPPVGKYRKSVDENAETKPTEPTDGVKSEAVPEVVVNEEPAEEGKKTDGLQSGFGEANVKETTDTNSESPKGTKLKVDEPVEVPPVPVAEPETKAPEPPKEEPTGIKPAQPTPSAAQPPKQPSPPAKSPEDILLDAAWSGDIQACRNALRHASPTTRDSHGLTPLHLACERDHLAIAMLLHDTGISSNVHDLHERTPLHLAARYGSSAIVEYLLDDCKADPNSKTDDGRTPLHYAAVVDDEERREVVRLLRDFGADPTVEDGRGRTARDLAQRRDLWDVSATLRRAEKRWEEDHHQNWFQRHGLKR
ncbi:hypothetical protein NW752_007360 [Fusarium irregulare]|uniref:Ankyrin n=1 Tax=Fusarium irregulare TaxID=2494466 RepID=A0A9W8U8J3_9HYPO|nr:hypothetical protein NW766_007740 [Fusarium irregulare]KAJ4014590.1 hypothetical protein NW752_007360 [Fusarium irregulare]